MAKIIDITEKLNFEKPPVLLIQGREIHVNDDAVTMLSVMQLIGAVISSSRQDDYGTGIKAEIQRSDDSHPGGGSADFRRSNTGRVMTRTTIYLRTLI